MKKIIVILLSLWIFICCNERREKKNNFELKVTNIVGYDTIKYNCILYLDTVGCWYHKFDNTLKDSLINEKAIVTREFNQVFFKTVKYDRLWVCKLTDFPIPANDTVLISANVYNISGSEKMPGQPTILYKLAYSLIYKK